MVHVFIEKKILKNVFQVGLVSLSQNGLFNTTWKKFEMKTMKEYHSLYLKCEILLIADIFKKFGNNSLKKYGLYPSHYLSASGLSCDAMLKMTNTKLQYIYCIYIYTAYIYKCIYIYIYMNCIYIYIFFEKVQEMEFLMFVKDTAKPTINI